jgi:hypothetical protein
MSDPTPEPGGVAEVTCQRCGKRTDRVHTAEAPVVAFIGVYIAWNHVRIAGCPSCVQHRLWQLFWLSIPAANVLFPFVGLLLFAEIQRSRKDDRPGIPEEFAHWAELPPPAAEPPRGKAIHVVLALVILAAVVAFVFFVLPRLSR